MEFRDRNARIVCELKYYHDHYYVLDMIDEDIEYGRYYCFSWNMEIGYADSINEAKKLILNYIHKDLSDMCRDLIDERKDLSASMLDISDLISDLSGDGGLLDDLLKEGDKKNT